MSIETLRPNAAGAVCQFIYEVGSDCPNHYLNVDEESADDDSSCNYTPESNKTDLYNIENHSVGSGFINKVTLKARIAWYGTESSHGQYGIRSNGANYWGDVIDFGAYANYSREYTTDPATGEPWTWAAIDALQIGCYVPTMADNGMKVTQMYIEVDYTPPAEEEPKHTFRLDPKPRKRMEFHPSLELG